MKIQMVPMEISMKRDDANGDEDSDGTDRDVDEPDDANGDEDSDGTDADLDER